MWELKKTSTGHRPPERESQFALGTGIIGQRTILSEVEGMAMIPGTFRNGFSDRLPMIHAEWAYGFPEEHEQMVTIPEVGTFKMTLDQQKLTEDSIELLEETLKLKTGLYKRTYNAVLGSKQVRVTLEKIASFKRKNLLATKVHIEYPGTIRAGFEMSTEVLEKEARKDPRVAELNHPLIPSSITEEESWLSAHFLTEPSHHGLWTSMKVVGEGASDVVLERTTAEKVHEKEGELTLECLVIISADEKDPSPSSIREELGEMSFDELKQEQEDWLKAFWETSDIVLKGDDEAQLGLRYALYSILSSASTTGQENIAAKGLTGEGYGGHTFWDTEMYMLPAISFSHPEIARALLEYRYQMLPAARDRANELGHHQGVAYPWRTITGLESSGYFPAGTAQYHLNADIAHAFVQYYLQTGDRDFLRERALPVLIETARLWLEIGHLSDDGFHIHHVTGPDEYTAIVSDNYFTNQMAKKNLYWALRAMELTGDQSVSEKERDQMREAHDQMVLLYDHKRGIHKQDSSFLDKPFWREEEDKRPLLLHYHPLTIYRHQVLKQADVVLANCVFSDETDAEIATRDFDYYEPLTTHDSSLSASVHAWAAARIGREEEALEHFRESVRLDMENTHQNTKDGLHMANCGGMVLALIQGFSGLSITEDGLSLAPLLPKEWQAIEFSLLYRGERVEVSISQEETTISCAKPLRISYYGQVHEVEKSLSLPLRDSHKKAVLFDMDGVLTSTSLQHFSAWQDLTSELGFSLPEEFEKNLRGISRRASLDLILEYGGQSDQYTENEKNELAAKKNSAYIKSLEKLSKEDLFPGVEDLFRELKRRGAKIALVSASRNAPLLLERLGIEEAFDAVVHPDDVAQGKPAPDPFLKGAMMLGVLPCNCLGVEDALAGIESIRAAGMWAVAIGEKDSFYQVKEVHQTIEDASPSIIRWLEGDYGEPHTKER